MTKISKKMLARSERILKRKYRKRINSLAIVYGKKKKFDTFLRARAFLNEWKDCVRYEYINKLRSSTFPEEYRPAVCGQIIKNDVLYYKTAPIVLEAQDTLYKGPAKMNILYIINQ